MYKTSQALTYCALAQTAEFPQGNNKLVKVDVLVAILVECGKYPLSEAVSFQIKQREPLNNIDPTNLLLIRLVKDNVKFLHFCPREFHTRKHFHPFLWHFVLIDRHIQTHCFQISVETAEDG